MKHTSPAQKKAKNLTSMNTIVALVLHEFRLGADKELPELVNLTGKSVLQMRRAEEGRKELTVDYITNLCNALFSRSNAPWATLPNVFTLASRAHFLLTSAGGWIVSVNPVQEDNLRGLMKGYYASHGYARRMHRQEHRQEIMLLVNDEGLLSHEIFSYILDTNFRAAHKELQKMEFAPGGLVRARDRSQEFSEAGWGHR